MRLFRHFLIGLFLCGVQSLCFVAQAQLGFDLKVQKPKPYEERVLKAEKTGQKAFKPHRRFFQNLTTHYNYFYNANLKLNDVLRIAKASHRDDFSTLLPFYNYSSDVVASNTRELDSVIYKSQTGIVMHDLRNDWADNLYLLWGAAWFFEKKYDSAALMFQFINHSFAEKEKDGYYKYIGSRLDGNNALSIATREDRRFPKNLVTPPSRNHAFIWQIRTGIEMGKFTEAGSLIATLDTDPLFPERLREELEEVKAYWFYKQGMWDSSATHLLQALDVATNKTERARWEFLAAQMLERSGKTEEAIEWYEKAIAHTTDPVLDVYARLNTVRIQKGSANDGIDANIEELLKMARRDRYIDYRDVIYFMAAQMELERNNFEAAQALLLKGSKYSSGNPAAKNRAFLQIADISFNRRNYPQALRFYDSVQVAALELPEVVRQVEDRKTLLRKWEGYGATVARQDSLQRIAALPEEERNALLNSMLRKIRKSQGVDDEVITGGNSGNNQREADLFSSQPTRGEWYFYNNSLRTGGQVKFKQVWGNRPNVDNWRRMADVSSGITARNPNNAKAGQVTNENGNADPNTISFASLLANLPISTGQRTASDDSIRTSLMALGSSYLNDAEDYLSAIATFEELRRRFPDAREMDEVLFNLYYAYKKSGDENKAASLYDLLTKGSAHAGSRFSKMLTTGKDPLSDADRTAAATKAYEGVYDGFIEGRFEEAIAAKRIADSTYRTTRWEPQLLYIEAIYHVKQRQDSLAKDLLQVLIAQGEKTPMLPKAQTMLDVLNRRAQIEAELTALQIVRPEEEKLEPPVVNPPKPPVVEEPAKIAATSKSDSSIKVNRSNTVSKPGTDLTNRTLGPPDTIARKMPPPSVDTVAGPVVATVKDTVAKTNVAKETVTPPVKKDTVVQRPQPTEVKRDTVAKAKPVPPAGPRLIDGYSTDTANRFYSVVVLNKVDPIFVNEVKNAFFRYSRDRYFNRNFELSVVDLDADRKLLLISSFNGLGDALAFTEKARAAAAAEIVPWLKSDKYSFSLLSHSNLDALVQKKDIEAYRRFLEQNLRVKL